MREKRTVLDLLELEGVEVPLGQAHGVEGTARVEALLRVGLRTALALRE
jgi:hypothetical protein